LEHVAHQDPPEGNDLEDVSGTPRWQTDFLWSTTDISRAGWVVKDGWGIWRITDAGRSALDRFPDPAAFVAEARAIYQAWLRARRTAQRRAWLIRGSSVRGANLVPMWLEEGWVSLAASQLRPIEHGISAEELAGIARQDYSHLTHQELTAKVDEIVAFVTKMTTGDVVITADDRQVWIGDVTGEWEWLGSDERRSNLRRRVEWRNLDAAVPFADLPDPLPAKLTTGATLADLTAQLDLLDGLATAEAAEEQAAPHRELPRPRAGLADELFLDQAWLDELRDLLVDRRQIVLSGPPGTGKTFIARKLAADLVGEEQVKLVQFHPAYTYEDFFEGYRPRPGAGEGTIAFELRPGPLRRLVTRAEEHREQHFVLIIDEINRANLAKVFGELYFLLEYRDQPVDLLYSSGDDAGFTLPKNLYLIGTMNTADRSIALVDAAMRRRFAFCALDPRTEPTRSLLRRWSAAHDLPPIAADLLDELNRKIDDPEMSIGPAYFMRSTEPDAFSRPRLERIWRTSILPLLQEQHYGRWDDVAERFSLDGLLRTVGDASRAGDLGLDPGPMPPG
jgi:5-methylcytosine-specific restriction protein B